MSTQVKIIFLPGDSSLQSIVETQSYKDIWKQHKAKLLEEFMSSTSLSFQQKQITARVHPNKNGESGNSLRAMTLPGNCRTYSAKCIVLTHELGHRLLSGNVLHGVRFGFAKPRWGTPEESEDELEHRLLYLFLGDVLQSVFGDVVSQEYNQLESSDPDSPHGRAYVWAVGMNTLERRLVLESISSDAILRGAWDNYDPEKIKFIGADQYRRKLDGLRDNVVK